MVNHKAFYFSAEPLRMILGYNYSRQSCHSRGDVHSFGEISVRYLQFWQDLGEILILSKSRGDLSKM